MLTVEIQILAEQDLQNIWSYTFENWGETQADVYYDELSKAILQLGETPHIGMVCDHISEGYRQLNVLKHAIFYRVTIDTVQIVRVLGAGMDFSRHVK